MPKKKMTEAVTGNDMPSKRWRSTFAAARLAYETGEFRQAHSLLARAKEGAHEIPDGSFAVHAADVGIGAILLAEKKSVEAGKHLDKCISKLNSFGDSLHRELLAVALRFHAQALADTGDERGAEKQLQQSAEILSGLGPDASVQLAYTLSDLCGLYVALGRQSEAEIHIKKAMKIASTVLGPESPEYVRADMIYQVCAPMEPDARMETASIGIRKMEYSFGHKHPNISRALDRYFKVLEERGDKDKLEEARENFMV